MWQRMNRRFLIGVAVLFLASSILDFPAGAEPQIAPDSLQKRIDKAVSKVKPALVRIHVVSTRYRDGREMKYESSGSGVIVSKEGHVVTNHHVAGHATRLVCTLSSKEEIEAELIGKDAFTDLAVIKLTPEEERTFPAASFGDSEALQAGDHVLAMGSPLALSQSVTLGIVSNTEIIMPDRLGRLELDGEDVGSLVRWIAHDAQIYPGNSGGPLVNLDGEIVGINEISMGLGGAIPGNLVKSILPQLTDQGEVKRAWLGMHVQPQLKQSGLNTGVLVSSVLDGAPAAEAGIQSGDYLIQLGDEYIDVQFPEQLPLFNQRVAELPIGEKVQAVLLREGKKVEVQVTPKAREKTHPDQRELRQWGITGRNISYMMAKEMQLSDQDGFFVTSVRPGGAAGDAKPSLQSDDIILSVGDKPVRSMDDLIAITTSLTESQDGPVPVRVEFERNQERFLTLVHVGVEELEQPSPEVSKAWLPVKVQVLTRELAESIGHEALTGFRITHVYANSVAEEAGLQVGDLILAVDGMRLRASAPEDYEELNTLIRQYRIGTPAKLEIQRDSETETVEVELPAEPPQSREVKKYEDANFEFTGRNISFFDKADRQWDKEQQGVLVVETKSGGWAALGNLREGDLILSINRKPVHNVDDLEQIMDQITEAKPEAVVFKVKRGIVKIYLELEPKWVAPV